MAMMASTECQIYQTNIAIYLGAPQAMFDCLADIAFATYLWILLLATLHTSHDVSCQLQLKIEFGVLHAFLVPAHCGAGGWSL